MAKNWKLSGSTELNLAVSVNPKREMVLINLDLYGRIETNENP